MRRRKNSSNRYVTDQVCMLTEGWKNGLRKVDVSIICQSQDVDAEATHSRLVHSRIEKMESRNVGGRMRLGADDLSRSRVGAGD